MRLKDYDKQDGKRVWLGPDELEQFIDQASSPEQRLAFNLAGRCGLRRDEILAVCPADFVQGPTGGQHVRIRNEYAKHDKYREPPVPDTVVEVVTMLAYERDDDEPLIETDHGSTVYRWVRRAADAMEDKTGDDGWQHLDVHDLRRTWGVLLLEEGVIPSVVMEWGGWSDWSVFRDHYLNELSPGALKRERSKVSWLGGDSDRAGEQSSTVYPQGSNPQNSASTGYR